jgi:gluconokinase
MQILIMGVSGSGKTTIGKRLAEELKARYIEGDDYHSEANKVRMAAGIPLDDLSRWDWLNTLARELRKSAVGDETAVLACSALKNSYRSLLLEGCTNSCTVWLSASPELLKRRLQNREHHFMPVSLLASQFADLEIPDGAITVDCRFPVDAILSSLVGEIQQHVAPCSAKI